MRPLLPITDSAYVLRKRPSVRERIHVYIIRISQESSRAPCIALEIALGIYSDNIRMSRPLSLRTGSLVRRGMWGNGKGWGREGKDSALTKG